MPPNDVCNKQPDHLRTMPSGLTRHAYEDVPDEDAPTLVKCRQKDKGYKKFQVADGSTDGVCNVYIFYAPP